jgi:hypothetical protein
VLGAAEQLRVLAQQARAHRVKRRRGDRSGSILAEQLSEAQSQLAGRADTERHGQDLLGSRLL